MRNLSRRQFVGVGLTAGSVALGAGLVGGKVLSDSSVPIVKKSVVLDYLVSNADGFVAPVGAVGVDSQLSVVAEIYVKLLFAESDKDGVVINDVWVTGDADFGYQAGAFLPVYDIGNVDYYVVLVNVHRAFGNDFEGHLADAVLAVNNDAGEVLEGFVYDADNDIVLIEKHLFKEHEQGLQMQFLLCVDDIHKMTVPVNYRVLYGDEVVVDDTLVAHSLDNELDIDLSEFAGKLAPDSICVGVDGLPHVFLYDGFMVDLDLKTNHLHVSFEPFLVDGVIVYIKKSGFFGTTLAYGIESSEMKMYPYGYLDYTPELTVNKTFSYTGQFIYPNNWIIGTADPNSIGNKAYMASNSVIYAYWNNRSTDNPDEYNAYPVRDADWNAIKARVADGPVNGTEVYESRNVGGTSMINRYYGQLMTLPGEGRTSDYTFKDKAYFSTLASSDIVTNDTVGAGVCPAFCSHIYESVHGEWNTWVTTPIRAKIMDVNLRAATPYLILALNTAYAAVGGNHVTQTATVILKVELRGVSGYLRVRKDATE